jgi:DNA-binding CsgD family transcriptional regulator
MRNPASIQNILIWQSALTGKSNFGHLPFSLDYLFLFPNQAAYIVDCQTGAIVQASSGFGRIFGYKHYSLAHVAQLYEPIAKPDIALTLQNTWQVIHWMFNNKAVPAFHNTAEFTYRFKHKNGNTHKLLRQTAACGKHNGHVTHTLGVLTDITNLDANPRVTVNVFGPNAHFFQPGIPELQRTLEIFTNREAQILALLAQGKTSKQIAAHLHLSSHTVDTHRRNMIRKLEVQNTQELTYLARELNLI